LSSRSALQKSGREMVRPGYEDIEEEGNVGESKDFLKEAARECCGS
jgi:hypothetical protein